MNGLVSHLHPLLVHLPIGILLLAAIFVWLGRKERYTSLLAALPILLRIGALTALLSCVSGWLLGSSGTYDPDILQRHQWLGIATTTLALLACVAPKKRIMITVMAALLIATGHFGGTLTHGEAYLTSSFSQGSNEKIRPVDVQEARAFAEVIAPIFNEKCVACHGSAKQKGGLRLDLPEMILNGGKSGAVLNSGDGDGGELLRRCLLSLGHEDHMPPKEKPQLTTDELEILRWWLAEGADFQKKTKELPQTAMVQAALEAWQKGAVESAVAKPIVPAEVVAPAAVNVLENLRRAGVLVLPVSQHLNWLSLNFVNCPNPPDSVIVLLTKIAQQTLWINMSGCQISEASWRTIGQLSNLRRLSLDHSSVSDSAMLVLKNLEHLESLNLSNTQVSEKGLQHIAGLQHLQTIFLHKTLAATSDWASLQALFPQTTLDTGGYSLPFLATDTARIKEPKEAYK
jgi:mono/diheme cytochrome c family protein/uncharacterized membrane protein